MKSKVFTLMHNFWIKIRLKSPSFAQQTVIPRLYEIREIIQLFIKPYSPIYQLQGQGQGGLLTVTYVDWGGYTRPFFVNLLFVEKPVEQIVGRIPFWRCNKLADLSSSDIIMVEATKHLIGQLSRQKAIVLPQLVDHILDVRGDWQDVQSRFRKTIHKNELRLIRKHGYEYDVSHDRQDFEEFYHQMCLPTTRERHGKLSTPFSLEEAYQYFRQGWLFRVKRNGIWVCGSICHLQHNTLVIDMVGVRNADEQLICQGATAATFYTAIHWANQNGCKDVNFLGSGSYLKGGLFQHKRKWGTTISIPPHSHKQIWIRIQHSNLAVSQFLKENPFVVIEEDKLYGLILVDNFHDISDEIKEKWKKLYATPGLTSLLIRPLSHFIQKPTNAAHSDLIIPISSEISEDSE